MDTDTTTTFFALLVLGGAVGVAVALVQPAVRAQLQDSTLLLAAMVAVGATLGSLYLSEVADFIPCQLCWYQRIAMYPLAVVLVIAVVRNDRAVGWYALPMAVAGGGVSIYHVFTQAFPDQGATCNVGAPCSAKLVEALGWMTIPQMAGLCFAMIAALVLLVPRRSQEIAS